MPWHISKWFLFPSFSWKQEGIFFFSNTNCEMTWKWNSQKCVWGFPLDCVPLVFFFFLTLRIFHIEPLVVSQSQFSFSCAGTSSCRGFCLWVSALVIYNSLYSPVCFSSFWSSSLLYDLISLADVRRVFGFQFAQLLFVVRIKCCQDKV